MTLSPQVQPGATGLLRLWMLQVVGGYSWGYNMSKKYGENWVYETVYIYNIIQSIFVHYSI